MQVFSYLNFLYFMMTSSELIFFNFQRRSRLVIEIFIAIKHLHTTFHNKSETNGK